MRACISSEAAWGRRRRRRRKSTAAAPSLLLAQSRGPTASDATSPSLAALNRTSERRLTRSFFFAARSWTKVGYPREGTSQTVCCEPRMMFG
jgi:hypothetical protein